MESFWGKIYIVKEEVNGEMRLVISRKAGGCAHFLRTIEVNRG